MISMIYLNLMKRGKCATGTRSRERGALLLDMMVSLPMLVLLLAGAAAVAALAFRSAFFLMADSELEQEIQMAVRQVADEARSSYEVRWRGEGCVFRQYRGVDDKGQSTYQVSYWVNVTQDKIHKLVWKDASRPLTGNHALAGVDITEFSCRKLAPRLVEIRLTGRSLVTKHRYTLKTVVYGPDMP
ncbi:hypothetical protein [Mitsuokella sp. WILCCON 0060]|uniref:hypothetical protein n=1 Tax=unclassified Mitsuokella TaxID=2637239 RepID=UPI003F0847BF